MKTPGSLLLEDLQKVAYHEAGVDPEKVKYGGVSKKFLDDLFRYMPFKNSKMISKEEKEYKKIFENALNAELPTKFENPYVYHLMVDYMEDIEFSAKKIYKGNLPPRPLIGSLPFGEVNGMVLPVEDSEEILIIIDFELFMFVNLMSKALTMAFPVERTENGFNYSFNLDEINKQISENPMPLLRLKDLIFSYLFKGLASSAQQYTPNYSHALSSSYLTMSAELFIMGHEYGHILEGHLSNLTSKKFISKKVEVERDNWEFEHKADAWGVILMIDSMIKKHKIDLTLIFWGADYLLSCFDIIYRSISIIQHGTEEYSPSESHPPPNLRKEIIREILIEHFSGADETIKFVKTFDKIIDTFWEEIKPELYVLHKKKVKLANKWYIKPESIV